MGKTTCYDLLGISENASNIEIKKAYLTMVAKYPQDTESEKLKQYHEAYERLVDWTAWGQNEKVQSLPKELKELYELAGKALIDNDFDSAISILKEGLQKNPDNQLLNNLLGKAYIMNDNTGKAVSIFEKLVKQDPLNVEYQADLARAYASRGYNKKALKQFQQVLVSKPNNLDVYDSIIMIHLGSKSYRDARAMIANGLQIAKENDLDDSSLLIKAVLLSIMAVNSVDLRDHLDLLQAKVSKEPMMTRLISDQLVSEMFMLPFGEECAELNAQTLNFLYELDPESEALNIIKEEHELYHIYGKMSEDEMVPQVLVDLSLILQDDCDCENCKVDRLMMEITLLEEINSSRKSLQYFKKNYPEIFALNASVYQKLLDPKKEKQLCNSLLKKYKSYKKLYPAEFEEYEEMGFLESGSYETETVVRTGPKIGRNDPCPCGSGKKYKKCCGANA